MALRQAFIISAVLLPLATASFGKGWGSPSESIEEWIPAQGYEEHSIPAHSYEGLSIPAHYDEHSISDHDYEGLTIPAHGYEEHSIPAHGYEEHSIPAHGYDEHSIHHVETKPNFVESLKVKKLATVEKLKTKKWSWLPSWPLWKGKEEIHEIPVIKETTHYPIWKIHKYKGIEVRPINVVEHYPQHHVVPVPIQQTLHTHQQVPVQHHTHQQVPAPRPVYLPPYQPPAAPPKGWKWPGPQTWKQPQVEVTHHLAGINNHVQQTHGIHHGLEQLSQHHIDEGALLRPFLGAGYSIETIQKLLPTFQKDPHFMDKLRLYTLKSGGLNLNALPNLPDVKVPVAVIPHPQVAYPEYQPQPSAEYNNVAVIPHPQVAYPEYQPQPSAEYNNVAVIPHPQVAYPEYQPQAEYAPNYNEAKNQLPNDIQQSPIPYDTPLHQPPTEQQQQYQYAYPPYSDLQNSYGQPIPQDTYDTAETQQVEVMVPPPSGVHAQKTTGRKNQATEPKEENIPLNNKPENQQYDGTNGQQDPEQRLEENSKQQ